jgi:hypothetical protein
MNVTQAISRFSKFYQRASKSFDRALSHIAASATSKMNFLARHL